MEYTVKSLLGVTVTLCLLSPLSEMSKAALLQPGGFASVAGTNGSERVSVLPEGE